MIIDPLTIIFLTEAIAVLAIILLFVTIFFTRNIFKLHQSEELNRHLQTQLTEKPAKLLEKAHEQSMEIIEQANKHANDILANTKSYEATSESAIKEKLEILEKDQAAIFTKASEEMKSAYQNMLSQIQEQDINTIRSMTKDIQSDVLADFQEFREDLEKETINSEKLVKEKVDEEYLTIEKELQEYKKQKYKKIDEDIYKILYRISEIVFSQAIPVDKHKQLVLEALETAKKEQVFK